MINWKTCIGLSLLMISGIEFLKIKDYYHPARITPLVMWLIVAFTLSVFTAAFLILNGVGIHRYLGRVTRKKVMLRTKEIGTRTTNVRGVAVASASTLGI